MANMQQVAYEAFMSAFYGMPFSVFLGERPVPGGKPVGWFRLVEHPDLNETARENPKQVMVAIRPLTNDTLEGVVEVDVHWLNMTAGDVEHPMLGQQTFHVPTLLIDESVIRLATEEVVVRVLDIFGDVLRGAGVAGPIDKVMAEYATEDSEDDDDLDFLDDFDPDRELRGL